METAHAWLKNNGYEDIAELISEIREEWKKQGKKTRRNWWDVLCGNKEGESKVVLGRKIPVLRAAQLRQGRPVTDSALCRNKDEKIPEVWENTRWHRSKLD